MILRTNHPSLIRGDETSAASRILSQRRTELEKEIERARRLHQTVAKADTGGPVVAAFYAPWEDPSSFSSFKDNASRLTHVMPVWFTLGADGQSLDLSNFDPDSYPNNKDVMRIADANGVNEFPVINNQIEGVPDEKRVAKLLKFARGAGEADPSPRGMAP